MNFGILLSGLIGAIIGASVTGGFHIWKFRRDEFSARCDEFCRAVQEAAALATEYWSQDFSKLANAKVSEAKLQGAQDLCDGLYANLRARLLGTYTGVLDQKMSELVDALTGGEFTVDGRTADVLRTRTSMQVAAATVVEVRRAHHETMPFSAIMIRIRENRSREIDLPQWWKDGKRKCD